MSSTATSDSAAKNESGSPNVNIKLYNTLTRTKEPFKTVEPGKVGIYLCGPTVYKEAHIGHMVGPVIFDTIKRYLTYCAYDVKWVVNITDVDDKLIAESNRRNLPMSAIAEEMTQDYLKNLKSFGVDQIDEMPRATEHMDNIISFIAKLIERGYAYPSEGDVYFEVEKDKQYGKLTNRTVEGMQGEGGEMASRKRSPGDFALWKNAKDGEPSWDSPWGSGRPGWHIECSAMSKEILGETFDIHGGGLDLIFPHHENELAQSECCHDKPMVNYWVHNGLMRADSASGKVGGKGDRDKEPAEADVSTKISRSAGAGGLAKLVGEQTGERLRFFLLRTHYRSTIVFGDAGLEEARVALETFYRLFERYERIAGGSFYELQAPQRRAQTNENTAEGEWEAEFAARKKSFLEKMDDDFNTGAAVSDLFELARGLNRYIEEQKLEDEAQRTPPALATLASGATVLRELANILGIFQTAPAADNGADDGIVNELMELMISLRAEARKEKNFGMADRIRDGLTEIGITLEDRKDGTGWKVERG